MIFRRTVRFKCEFKELSAGIQKIARAKFALFALTLHRPAQHRVEIGSANAIFAETFNAKRRAIEAAAPDFDALRETLRYTAEVFQVSP